jgi:hypothetical protein
MNSNTANSLADRIQTHQWVTEAGQKNEDQNICCVASKAPSKTKGLRNSNNQWSSAMNGPFDRPLGTADELAFGPNDVLSGRSKLSLNHSEFFELLSVSGFYSAFVNEGGNHCSQNS